MKIRNWDCQDHSYGDYLEETAVAAGRLSLVYLT